MGFGKKYSTSHYGSTKCCDEVQSSPSPCCESHSTRAAYGACLRPVSDVVASSSGFVLIFKDLPSGIEWVPLNGKDVFFYYSSTGLIRILGKRGAPSHSYEVELVDPSRNGMIIPEDACVMVTVVPATSTGLLNSRCVVGNFAAPGVNQSATMYISHGSGIPIGATLTLTANGDTGSYTVTNFISSNGNVHAYTVNNAGQGLTPGTIIDGGPLGTCSIPIELITEIDLCDLSTTQSADKLTACVNGSPRAVVPAGPNSVLVGDALGKWGQRTLSNLDCCVTLDGCLKFSGLTCSAGDKVVLKNQNLSCFIDRFEEAQAIGQGLPMNINGFPVIITDYSEGSRIVTVVPASTNIDIGTLQFDAGSQMCIGDCCANCDGPRVTDTRSVSPFVDAANIAFQFGTFNYSVGTNYFIAGFTADAQPTVQRRLTDYFNAPSATGPRLPITGSDPMMLRNKICNDSPKGCKQLVKFYLNYQLILAPIAADVTVDWEIGHYAGPSATLLDGATPNPFSNISTQSKAAGTILHGPGYNDTVVIGNSSFGFGFPGQSKVFPCPAGFLIDFINLDKCSCALSVVWVFLRVQASIAGTMSMELIGRRFFEKSDKILIGMPQHINRTHPDNAFAS